MICHPATQACDPSLEISVSLAAAGGCSGIGLLLRYEVRGDLNRLRIPDTASPGPADGLWKHTCFEAFVARSDEAAYREFNFSPSGNWAAYRFSDQRIRDESAEALQPQVRPDLQLELGDERLTLLAWLPQNALPECIDTADVQIGLTAVIESIDGRLSYWALHHPAERPDFHHRGGFQPAFELQQFFKNTP